MTFIPYSDLLSFYVLFILLIPAVILGLNGKRINRYGIIISIPMLCFIMGFLSLQMYQFLTFIFCESVLVFCYFYISKKRKNNIIYYLTLLFSMIPILLIKICAHIEVLSMIGFIGISYISFRVWQIIIEIRDGHIDKLSLLTFLYFLTFFPTISSGPIDRYNRFQNNLNKKITSEEYINDYFKYGLKKLFLGILYKFILANAINLFIIVKIPQNINFNTTLIYMYSYTLYLFFDFAGYSNFAIGISYLLGIKSPENFNKPFLSRNMKEFWERWHISLSKWFSDYLFSRFVLNTLRNKTFKSKQSAARAGFLLTMTAMGIWHGFYAHYILYGIYQGLMLILTDIYLKSKFYLKYKKAKYYNIISRVICFQFITFGMLIFSGYLFKF